jgi:hypothetical protein
MRAQLALAYVWKHMQPPLLAHPLMLLQRHGQTFLR